MRIKMQKHLGTSQWQQQAGKFHLKQDAGGIIDIEFLAQFAVLAYSHEHPSLTKWSDNVRIFEEVASLGIWEEQVCQDLTDAYLRIRAVLINWHYQSNRYWWMSHCGKKHEH